MHDETLPGAHENESMDRIRPYISAVVEMLGSAGVAIESSWLDPVGPRDATILLDDERALVWDEETGWRLGRFAGGRQGVRTRLAESAHLGGGLLPTPQELARRLANGAVEAPRRYRAGDEGPELLDAQVRALYGDAE